MDQKKRPGRRLCWFRQFLSVSAATIRNRSVVHQSTRRYINYGKVNFIIHWIQTNISVMLLLLLVVMKKSCLTTTEKGYLQRQRASHNIKFLCNNASFTLVDMILLRNTKRSMHLCCNSKRERKTVLHHTERVSQQRLATKITKKVLPSQKKIWWIFQTSIGEVNHKVFHSDIWVMYYNPPSEASTILGKDSDFLLLRGITAGEPH